MAGVLIFAPSSPAPPPIWLTLPITSSGHPSAPPDPDRPQRIRAASARMWMC